MADSSENTDSSRLGPHVIFDMDGVLLDSEPVYMLVEGALVRELNPAADLYSILDKILGRTSRDTARLTLDSFNINMTVDEYIRLRTERLVPAMRDVKILPGVNRLVRWLSEKGVSMAIATSSPKVLLDAKRVGKEDFFNMFEAIICGDDVNKGKPDPEIFLAAAAAMGVKASDCIVFEDAPSGIRGAKSANMVCVALPNPDVDPRLYEEAKPDFVIANMGEFQPESVGLPSFHVT